MEQSSAQERWISVSLLYFLANSAEAGAGCLSGPSGLGGKILKYQTYTQYYLKLPDLCHDKSLCSLYSSILQFSTKFYDINEIMRFSFNTSHDIETDDAIVRRQL